MAAIEYLSLSRNGEWIRVLELCPGSFKDQIQCSLRIVSLKTRPQYETLSYCWGDPKVTAGILCDGALVQVTTNLHTALQWLRKEDATRTLWVDALCINQNSNDEKNHQVGMMREIYSCSVRTLVWLGEETEESKSALFMIPDLAQLSESFQNLVPDMERMTNEEWEKHDMHSIFDESRCKAFASLFSRPWFERVWVIQEVVVAQDAVIILGASSVSFSEFSLAASAWQQLGLSKYFHCETRMVHLLWESRQTYGPRVYSGLFSLLLRHRHCKATDPRDKIFALCGMASDANEDQNLMHVDKDGIVTRYTTSGLSFVTDYNLDILSVYQRFAVCCLKRDRNLDLFAAVCRTPQSQISGLPSWVPDWSIWDGCDTIRPNNPNDIFDGHVDWRTALGDPKSNFKFPSRPKGHFQRVFSTALSSELNITFSYDEQRVSLAGIVFDSIVELGLVCDRDEGFNLKNHLNILRNWQGVCNLDSESKYIGDEDRTVAYWRTVSVGHTYLKIEDAKPMFEQYFLDVLLKTEWAFENETSSVLSEAEQDAKSKILDEMHKGRERLSIERLLVGLISMANRRMARSSQGYFALVPACVEVGDSIGIFSGGDMPIMLRSRGSSWEVLGECYVHGIMHGEVFMEEACKQIELI
jgi:Heterokaryon incompatibility protein (HET)